MIQSKRRMLVAQKRLERGDDVLRRKVTFSTEDIYFWDWIINAPCNEYSWFSFSPRQAGLIGNLPGNRQLTKPLTVNLIWEGEWVVSEPLYSIHAAGPTIRKAMASFRNIFTMYLDGLSKHNGLMSERMRDCLAYLREMIEEVT
jgi:hypothetical protein